MAQQDSSSSLGSPEVETASKDEKGKKKEEPEPEPEEEPCPTKPFHQCSGMNFTQTKAEKKAFNFTSGGDEVACCPAGTSCVSFGPVWGMCMPSWGPKGPK